MTEAERRQALARVADEVRGCTRCRLHEGRKEAVPGEGHPSTEVLLVGEAPGLNEDRQGRPFVGAAGQFLAELLASVGWSRDEVFITNVVKCRPPQNRDPEPDEIAACAPFLRRQAEILDPALVVTLGRYSMGRFMPGARIGQVHGTTAAAPADTGAQDALVFAMYHPAAALHQASLRQTLLDDMASVPVSLLEARRRRDASRAPTVTGPLGPERGPDEVPGTAAEPSLGSPEPTRVEPAESRVELSLPSEPSPAPPEPASLEPAGPRPAPVDDLIGVAAATTTTAASASAGVPGDRWAASSDAEPPVPAALQVAADAADATDQMTLF